MPLSRINISATTDTAAAFKLPASTRSRSFLSRASSRPISLDCAPHPIRKRCFGSRCHKAAPDHSLAALLA